MEESRAFSAMASRNSTTDMDGSEQHPAHVSHNLYVSFFAGFFLLCLLNRQSNKF